MSDTLSDLCRKALRSCSTTSEAVDRVVDRFKQLVRQNAKRDEQELLQEAVRAGVRAKIHSLSSVQARWHEQPERRAERILHRPIAQPAASQPAQGSSGKSRSRFQPGTTSRGGSAIAAASAPKRQSYLDVVKIDGVPLGDKCASDLDPYISRARNGGRALMTRALFLEMVRDEAGDDDRPLRDVIDDKRAMRLDGEAQKSAAKLVESK